MKKNSSLKLILAMLVIVLLCLVSIGGIYVQEKNFIKNILPEYSLGMDLDTKTIIKLDALEEEESSSNATEEETSTEDDGQVVEEENKNAETTETDDKKENEEETSNSNEKTKTETIKLNYTENDFKKSKKIIEERLNKSGIEEVRVRLLENTGNIILEVPNDTDTSILQNMFVVGKATMKIVDSDGKDVKIVKDNNGVKLISSSDENQNYSENDLIKFDNSFIKKVDAVIDDSYVGYGVGSYVKLNIEFTKDTVEKLNQIKNSYVVPKDEEGNSKEYNMEILLDESSITNSSITLTSFLDSVISKTTSLRLGSYTTDEKELKDTLKEANVIKTLIETGTLPVKYKVDYTNDIHSNVKPLIIVAVSAVAIALMFVYLVIKHKLTGAISATTILGFLSLILLAIRYDASLKVAVSGIVAICVMVILQFIYLLALLGKNKMNSKIYTEETIKFTKMLIPAFIVSVVLPFTNILEMSSFGKILFWGLILFEIFNNIITRAIIINVKNK